MEVSKLTDALQAVKSAEHYSTCASRVKQGQEVNVRVSGVDGFSTSIVLSLDDAEVFSNMLTRIASEHTSIAIGLGVEF